MESLASAAVKYEYCDPTVPSPLPPASPALPHLKVLRLVSTKFTNITPSLASSLRSLTSLNLCGCNITGLPAALRQITKLCLIVHGILQLEDSNIQNINSLIEIRVETDVLCCYESFPVDGLCTGGVNNIALLRQQFLGCRKACKLFCFAKVNFILLLA
jgi:hypothetical protein